MSELPMSAEERLAALERKVAMMWNGGGDLLGTEGYLQIGNSSTPNAVRLDGKALQVATGTANNSAAAVFFVPELDANPLLNGPHTVLNARYNAGAGSVTSFYTVKLNPTQVGSGAHAFVGLASNATNCSAQLQADFADDGVGVYIKVVDDASDPRIVWSIDGGFTEYRLEAGGSMPTPITMGPQSLLAIGSQIAANATTAASSSTFPSANRAILYPFDITEDITVTQLWSYNGATASGNIDVGIYDSAFGLVVSSGTTAQSGTNSLQVFNVTDTPLSAGQYYMAVAMDNTTGTLFRQSFAADHMRAAGCFQMASAFVLPSTITPAAVATAYLPIVGWTRKTTI